ncbi:uncharacterized protein LOC123558939 [Mercenaria mercenaria]|uniref:uncharacterized protein LOC123558939 n=1 Tax=Mercenaria mercenaria TaxID=6596 RepID=UPI00234E66E0|nr:uncharacterized protein LOC123558939 [Mercenaria mercenaria]XP_053399323.1 uncharacterized protein LOC123558939 [Mercenaria mercenaria]
MNFGLVLLGFIVVHGASLGPEPQCSKFHYEEQLLEKMIRMEVRVEEIEKRISKTNQHVHQTLEDLKTERRDLKNDYNELQTRYSQEMEEHIAEIGKLKDTLLTETIAFKARVPADKSLETGQTILFTETMFNKGNGYDNMTGLFTVPVSGTYLFTIHLCIKYKMNMFYGIMVDNTVQTSGVFYDSTTDHCNTADAITVLKAGERVYVKCLSTSSGEVLTEYNSSTRNYWSTFSGLLIHK